MKAAHARHAKQERLSGVLLTFRLSAQQIMQMCNYPAVLARCPFEFTLLVHALVFKCLFFFFVVVIYVYSFYSQHTLHWSPVCSAEQLQCEAGFMFPHWTDADELSSTSSLHCSKIKHERWGKSHDTSSPITAAGPRSHVSVSGDMVHVDTVDFNAEVDCFSFLQVFLPEVERKLQHSRVSSESKL